MARGGSADSEATCQADAQDGLNFDEIATVLNSRPEPPAKATAQATWKLAPPPPPPPPPRFMFYSQETGQISADSLEALAIPVPSDPVATVLQQRILKWLRSADYEASVSYMQPVNVSILVLRECVLSFHTKPVEQRENVLQRIAHLGSYGLHITPDWLNYAIIDDITDGFQPLIKSIELEVDSKVMQLFRLLSTKADVLKTVIKRCGQRLPDDSETSLYLGDIQDHAITMVQNLIHFEKTLDRNNRRFEPHQRGCLA
ncbi:CorA metal ion transporter [Geranomyces variabilis]|uniref:CorA metal ion transporter n=1 Tax=Geranomyces variabilis TaxID=109894 RepID=A0AAD5TP80_9FUNG|nr:CorA metal ion transporter [Geranomyces variabilis]